jgi:DNA (cytosine-5)-methyltransferase 1
MRTMVISSFTKSKRAQNVDDFETWIAGGVSPTLNAMDNNGEAFATVLIIDGTRVNDVRVYEDGIVPTVIQRWGTGGGNVPMVFPIDEGVAYGLDEEQNGKKELFGTLKARTEGGGFEGTVAYASVVRRLTPMECERLQGFPDDWTADQADSNRYKQCGNAVAVPVVEWIIKRMVGND